MRLQVEIDTKALSNEEMDVLERKLKAYTKKAIKELGYGEKEGSGSSFVYVVIAQTMNDLGHRV